MKLAIPLIFAGSLLGACTSGPELGELSDFVLEDLKQARAIAERGNDTLALQCYDFLIPIVEARIDFPETEIVGGISGYQQTRNARRFIEGRESDEFKLACAPLISDSKSVLKKLFLASPL